MPSLYTLTPIRTVYTPVASINVLEALPDADTPKYLTEILLHCDGGSAEVYGDRLCLMEVMTGRQLVDWVLSHPEHVRMHFL